MTNITDEQRELQEDFEIDCRKDAIKRYESSIRKDIARDYYSNTKAGRAVIHEDVKGFGMVLLKDNKKRLTQAAGRTNGRQVAQPVQQIIKDLGNSLSQADLKLMQELHKITDEKELRELHGAYALSMIGLKTIYDFYNESTEARLTVAGMAKEIGERIEDEIALIHYYRVMPEDVVKKGRKKARDPYATPKNRRYAPVKLMKNIMERRNQTYEEFKKFGDDLVLQLGIYILELATQCEYLAPKNKYDTDKQKQQKVVYSGAKFERLTKLQATYRSKEMIDKPLLIKPDDWVKNDSPDRFNRSGGYYTKFAKRRKYLCRSWYSDTSFSDMTYELINRMQAVAWQVDTSVLEVATQLLKTDYTIGSFQACPPVVQPLIRDESLSDQEQTKRRLEKRDEHERHIRKEKQYMRTDRTIKLATEYQNKGEFYYPWTCDWRGRLYPATSAPLQIQGTDLERSLLKFRKGCELTESGKMWADRAVGAAKLGTSTSYAEREDWTKNNLETIQLIANDPYNNIALWEKAKEPWSFLQLCIEYNAVLIEKTQALWYVPVGIDSTASGLQLLSGILRDEQGMKYANLLPASTNDKPLDAYMKVLELAKKDAVAEEKDHLLKYLQDRSVGKPSLMLSVYGGSFPTIRNRLEEYFEDKEIDISREDVNDVTRLVIAASKKTFPAAYKALSWLRKVARQSLKTDKSIYWNTGAGDRIHLIKNKLAIMTVHTEILGKINVCMGEQNDAPDINGMVDAFAPSWVHTLDSNLVKYAFHDFDQPFALIHDCLRCSCNDMSAAVERIKVGFRRVCTENSLESLAEDLGVKSDTKDNPLPKHGDDSLLNKVQKSQYLFN